jgi:hypothetical protein
VLGDRNAHAGERTGRPSSRRQSGDATSTTVYTTHALSSATMKPSRPSVKRSRMGSLCESRVLARSRTCLRIRRSRSKCGSLQPVFLEQVELRPLGGGHPIRHRPPWVSEGWRSWRMTSWRRRHESSRAHTSSVERRLRRQKGQAAGLTVSRLLFGWSGCASFGSTPTTVRPDATCCRAICWGHAH